MAEKVVVRSLEALSALVAERVMGEAMPSEAPSFEEAFRSSASGGYPSAGNMWLAICLYEERDVPRWIPRPFAESIGPAWSVVERMREEGWKVVIILDGRTSAITMYPPDGKGGAFYSESSDTLPVNACLAALRAKGVEVELQLEGGWDG